MKPPTCGTLDYTVEEFEHAGELWTLTLAVQYEIEPYYPATRDSPPEGGGVDFNAIVKEAYYDATGAVAGQPHTARVHWQPQALQDAWDEREGYYQSAIDEKCREDAEDSEAAAHEDAADARRDAQLERRADALRERHNDVWPEGAD